MATAMRPRAIAGFPRHYISRAIARGRIKLDRKSTRLNSSHLVISYAVFCLKKKHNALQPRSLTRLEEVVDASFRPLPKRQTFPQLFASCRRQHPSRRAASLAELLLDYTRLR